MDSSGTMARQGKGTWDTTNARCVLIGDGVAAIVVKPAIGHPIVNSDEAAPAVVWPSEHRRNISGPLRRGTCRSTWRLQGPDRDPWRCRSPSMVSRTWEGEAYSPCMPNCRSWRGIVRQRRRRHRGGGAESRADGEAREVGAL